jgi:3-hydroxyisobutyrate dehydrogenase-like beta-hydroxyacid dehydrogenase
MSSLVGFIGLGIIGLPMAERLLEKGQPLVVWNRSVEKATTLAARGAQTATSPRELAARCDVVITMVTDGPALEDVTCRADGISAGLRPGGVHCDMSTIDPDTTRRIAAHHAARRTFFVHAPVLGSKRAAASGTLLIFAGGSSEAREKCTPVFDALGQKRWQWEEPEKATCTKLACNLLLAGMMEQFSESLVFAKTAGVDPVTLLEIIFSSALSAPMFQTKGEAMVQGSFVPTFYLRNMLKDLNLVAQAAAQLEVNLPGSRAVREAYSSAARAGLGELDYSAVVQWLDQNST